MNLRKVIFVFALLASAAVSAETLEYLYWQVDLENNNPWDVPDFSYATVRSSSTGERLSFYNTSGAAIGDSLLVNDYGDVGDVGQTTPKAYSGTQNFSGSYVFELWKEKEIGADVLVGWATYEYSKLRDYISTAMGQTGATALVITAIPEPSSALLLVFGLAGLALRRKKRALKKMLPVIAAVLSANAFAAADNLVYSFQPSADDTYADGTPVMLGERYALVWLTSGSDGVDIAADGSVTDSSKGEIVKIRKSSTQKKGRIFTFEVDAKVRDALIEKGGSWAVYLLDTRVYNADGAVALAEATDDGVAAINAAKRLDKSVVSVSAMSVQSNTVKTDADSASVATAVPADTPNPTVTGIEVVSGKVHVKVANTVPYLAYNLAGGERPDAVDGRKAESPKNGIAGGEIELVAPATGGSAFFRVNRN